MGVSLLGPAEIRALAERLDVSPTKKLGQNFVHDANTVRRIVGLAGVDEGDQVLEVGPGLGSLTLALLEAGAHVTAVEIDERLGAELPATVSRLAPGVSLGGVIQDAAHESTGNLSATEVSSQASAGPSLQVVIADAMRVTELPRDPEVLVANLPYNVSVPVLLTLLGRFDSIHRALVMVQAEVGHRIAAQPGSKVYGAPSVKCSWYGEWRVVGTVARHVFWPVPNVDSVLVAFDRGKAPGTLEERTRMFALVDAAFQQRRKMLRQSLAPVLGADTVGALERAGVDPTLRGEQLRVGDFLALARASSLGP